MIEFINNNDVLIFTSVSPFYANKGFHFCMNFNFDTTDYIITRKRLDIAKIKNIIDHI